MTDRLALLPCLAAVLAAQTPAPRPAAPPAVVRKAPAAEAAAEARLRRDVAFLASPALKGRGNGEPGLEQAATHLVARYKALGLPVQVHRMPFPTAVVKEEALAELNFGDGAGRTLAWGQDVDVLWASGDGSFRYKALVFAGYGLGAPARQDLEGLDLRGKVVLMLREVPAAAAPHTAPLETSMLARAKALIGARPAAVVFLEEAGKVPAMVRMDGAALLPFPALTMTVDAAASVCADLKDRIARLKASGEAQSRDYVYAPWSYLNLTLKLRREEALLPLVAAELKGSDPKLRSEVVALGAHLDHLGTTGRHSMASGPARSEAHPGADDNASGTALVMELARSLKARRPKRSVHFLHFPGEEEGLLGSAWWLQQPAAAKERVRFMLNFDMVGRLDPAQPVLHLGPYGAPKAALERARTLAEGLEVKGGDGLPAGGSDHMSFAAQRIPTFFFFTGLHADYHRPSDTAEKVNAAGMARLASFAAKVAWDLGSAPDLPAFDPETAKPPKAVGSPMRIAFGTLPDYAGHPKGFRITGVSAGSTAEGLGLKGGDVIVEFGGRPIRDIQDYMAALGAFKPGDKVLVKWLRGDAPLEAEAVLKGRP